MLARYSINPPSIDPAVGAESKSELSLIQEQIWVFEQITPGTAVYNNPLVLHFNGYLDVKALERSLMELVRRHDVLRARFPAVEGRPVQIVGVLSALTLSRIDVPEANHADRLESVKHACEAECSRPFDLVHGPPIRFTLFRQSPVEQVLLSHGASSRLRRMVKRHLPAGVGGDLCRPFERAAFPTSTSLDPVFRLCSRTAS